MEETENVANMPELFRIEAHRSEQTGIQYISFISWTGPTPDGEWTDIQMTDDDIHELLNVVRKGKVLEDD